MTSTPLYQRGPFIIRLFTRLAVLVISFFLAILTVNDYSPTAIRILFWLAITLANAYILVEIIIQLSRIKASEENIPLVEKV